MQVSPKTKIKCVVARTRSANLESSRSLVADMASDIERRIVMRVFSLPIWYMPSTSEINRLFSYILREDSESEARLARFLDCSAFFEGNDCFFRNLTRPVYSVCCGSRMLIARGH